MRDHCTAVQFGAQLALVPQESIEYFETTNHHRSVQISRVIPCHVCNAPVCVIEIARLHLTRVCDAVRDAPGKSWHTDLFTEHVCKVNCLWDTFTLRQVMKRTRRHNFGCGGFFFVDVRFVVPCGQCGELIAPVRFDGGPIEFFKVTTLTVPPEFWLDRHTTPDEYIANLGYPHNCRISKEGVRQ